MLYLERTDVGLRFEWDEAHTVNVQLLGDPSRNVDSYSIGDFVNRRAGIEMVADSVDDYLKAKHPPQAAANTGADHSKLIGRWWNIDGPVPCRTDGCDEDPDTGEGWDGYCGNCADRLTDTAEHVGKSHEQATMTTTATRFIVLGSPNGYLTCRPVGCPMISDRYKRWQPLFTVNRPLSPRLADVAIRAALRRYKLV